MVWLYFVKEKNNLIKIEFEVLKVIRYKFGEGNILVYVYMVVKECIVFIGYFS